MKLRTAYCPSIAVPATWRYIDSDDSQFQLTSPKYVNTDSISLDVLYKFRVLSTKKF